MCIIKTWQNVNMKSIIQWLLLSDKKISNVSFKAACVYGGNFLKYVITRFQWLVTIFYYYK